MDSNSRKLRSIGDQTTRLCTWTSKTSGDTLRCQMPTEAITRTPGRPLETPLAPLLHSSRCNGESEFGILLRQMTKRFAVISFPLIVVFLRPQITNLGSRFLPYHRDADRGAGGAMRTVERADWRAQKMLKKGTGYKAGRQRQPCHGHIVQFSWNRALIRYSCTG